MLIRLFIVFSSISPAVALPGAKPVALKKAPAARAAPSVRTLPEGTGITVIDFDAETNTFLVSLNEATAVGPNYATPENLHRAIGFTGSLTDFKKQQSQMIGSLYQTEKPLPLIGEDEMSRREKKARSGERAY